MLHMLQVKGLALSDDGIVASIILTGFSRAGDSEGMQYWSTQLAVAADADDPTATGRTYAYARGTKSETDHRVHRARNHISTDRTHFHYSILIDGYGRSGQVNAIDALVTEMKGKNVPMEFVTATALIRAYSRCGANMRLHRIIHEIKKEDARRLAAATGTGFGQPTNTFAEAVENSSVAVPPKKSPFLAVDAAAGDQSGPKSSQQSAIAISNPRDIGGGGYRRLLTIQVYTAIIHAFTSSYNGRGVLNTIFEVRRRGMLAEADAAFQNAAIRALSRCGLVDDMEKLWSEFMADRNVVRGIIEDPIRLEILVSTMLTGHMFHGRFAQMAELLERVQQPPLNFVPGHRVWQAILNGYANASSGLFPAPDEPDAIKAFAEEQAKEIAEHLQANDTETHVNALDPTLPERKHVFLKPRHAVDAITSAPVSGVQLSSGSRLKSGRSLRVSAVSTVVEMERIRHRRQFYLQKTMEVFEIIAKQGLVSNEAYGILQKAHSYAWNYPRAFELFWQQSESGAAALFKIGFNSVGVRMCCPERYLYVCDEYCRLVIAWLLTLVVFVCVCGAVM